MEKHCSQCGQTKSIEDFHRNRAQPSGFASQCKSCANAARYSGKRAEQHRAYGKAYRQTPEGKAVLRACTSRYEENEKGKASRERRRRRYPERLAARAAVNRAILCGRIPSPYSLRCAECGGAATEYHHFAGYDVEHWFDIDAVCKSCHVKLAKANHSSQVGGK